MGFCSEKLKDTSAPSLTAWGGGYKRRNTMISNDPFFRQTTCDRCGGSLAKGRTMSMFNTDTICLDCKEAERKRSDYDAAVRAEVAACRAGNYNFKGVGLR